MIDPALNLPGFTNTGAPVLDQDSIVLRAVQTEDRQSLMKYCGLRIMSYM